MRLNHHEQRSMKLIFKLIFMTLLMPSLRKIIDGHNLCHKYIFKTFNDRKINRKVTYVEELLLRLARKHISLQYIIHRASEPCGLQLIITLLEALYKMLFLRSEGSFVPGIDDGSTCWLDHNNTLSTRIIASLGSVRC